MYKQIDKFLRSKGIYKSFTYTRDSYASHFNETCTQKKLLCIHTVSLHGMCTFGMNSHLSSLTSIYRIYNDFLFTKQFQIPLFSDLMFYYFSLFLLSSFLLNYFYLFIFPVSGSYLKVLSQYGQEVHYRFRKGGSFQQGV